MRPRPKRLGHLRLHHLPITAAGQAAEEISLRAFISCAIMSTYSNDMARRGSTRCYSLPPRSVFSREGRSCSIASSKTGEYADCTRTLTPESVLLRTTDPKSDEGTVVPHVKNARRVCDAVGAVSRKPSSQIMENSSESLSGASCRGRLVRGRLCYCDVWLRSCRETEGQRKRAMEWNKHVARSERVKANEHTHSIAAQERETPALMTATTAVESLRFPKRGW